MRLWLDRVLSSYLKTLAVAALSGGCMTLAFAPFECIFAAMVSFLMLLYLIHASAFLGFRRVFSVGFFWGIGHFLSSLYWISYALLFESEKFAWLIPLCLLLIPGLISLFIGCFALSISLIIRFLDSRVITSLSFASGWVVFEFLRSYAIIDFPWNLTGYSSGFSLYFSQLISVVGVSGAGFVIALASVSFYTKNLRFIVSSYLIVLSCFLFGYFRVEKFDLEPARVINLRIVQPNFQDFLLDNVEKRLGRLKKLVELSNRPGYETRDIIIWPESSFPFPIIDNAQQDLKVLRGFLASRALLAFGADSHSSIEGGRTSVRNSLFFVNAEGRLESRYDKVILVPFGEYVPFKKFLPNLSKIAGGIAEFEPGEAFGKSVEIQGVGQIIPMICFESIFPALHNSELINNAIFVLNITNDLWFGNSIGPYQHLTMARIRAIEYGLSLVRVANSGVSAVFDCYGRVLYSSDLGTEDVRDYQLQVKRVASPYVLYALKRPVTLFLLFFFSLSFVCAILRANNRQKP